MQLAKDYQAQRGLISAVENRDAVKGSFMWRAFLREGRLLHAAIVPRPLTPLLDPYFAILLVQGYQSNKFFSVIS